MRSESHGAALALRPLIKVFQAASFFAAAVVFIGLFGHSSAAQQPVVVQPGAPGEPTRSLPSLTRPTLPPISRKDIEFMQGMIMHHAQAVEMTALIDDRSENKQLRLLGTRISHSQSDEMRFMRNWLVSRGQPTEMKSMAGMSTQPVGDTQGLMPGMLTAAQMAALKNAKGADFDRLFLQGMIQHHTGALTMVKELFESSGSGQDPELFEFVTDVDSGQRAEIRIMQAMLDRNP